MKYREGQRLRVKGEPEGSINEFVRIKYIVDKGVLVANLNMPYMGTISKMVDFQNISEEFEIV